MKFLLGFLLVLAISCAYGRPGGHGWAPPAPPPRTYHIIKEVVQARHEPPPQVVHVSLEQAPPQVHYAPPKVIHVQLQRAQPQWSAPPAPPPQVIRVIQQQAPPQQTGGGWW